jgi:ArsR family transcriptional regulator, arsenate/arsenite/antimonite-responsive transcriptional repressor
MDSTVSIARLSAECGKGVLVSVGGACKAATGSVDRLSRYRRTNSVNSSNMDSMDSTLAIAALAALAQSTRLETFRLLVSREPDGVAAGELARLLAIPQNTMSAHLAVLARAGLVRGERRGRSIMYRAELARLRDVTLFLVRDCCGGRPEVCAPLLADLLPTRPAEATSSCPTEPSTSCSSAPATARGR